MTTAAERTTPQESPAKEVLSQEETLASLGSYQFGWHDSDVAGASAQRGLNEAVVRDISSKKDEPDWMLQLRLKALGMPIIDHGSHIVPVHVGSPVHCKMLSDMLLSDFGIYVQPINFPTVPRGTERLRFTPSPVHDGQQIDHLVRAMDALWSHCALNRAEAVA